MCGISGIVGADWERWQLEAMVVIQHHRGPDDSGIYIDETGMVGLGHNRLSIIDLSPAGHQPMSNYNGTLWIVFNGEIYNHVELRTELSHYPYRSQTDTEVILAAYERWGDSCVEHFVGMFAFAIWDAGRQRLFCARDRLGIKPFHYAWRHNCFLFASEIKALLASGLPTVPNWAVWASYLAHGFYDHSTETFFAGVSMLPPGHTLTLQDSQTSIRCYWDLPSLANEPLLLDDDEAAAHLMALFEDAVRLRLRSDVPLGVNLSGGLDSASLMVTVDRLLQAEGEVQTFTASFADPQYDEREFASEVPRYTRWARYVQRLDTKNVWDVASEALWHQEVPYGGIATLAYHHLHRLAREHDVTVLLEGQGVDEMLAGYNYFRPFYYLDLLEQGGWQLLRQELRAGQRTGSVGLEALRRLRAGDTLNVYQDGTSHLHPQCILPEVRMLSSDQPQFPQPFCDHLNNVLYRDLCYTKLPRVLRMNDRLSMAFSRELREPYLDHRVVEYAFRLPGCQKIRLGHGKFLLRHAMAGQLPDSVRLASKRGVVTPQREWLRTLLRPQVDEIISSHSFAKRGLFDVQKVQAAYRRFCAGEGENAFFVWQWINTELWFRRFIDGE
jgi:asparagine synthase (glutamine-hydrolysing)